MKLNTSISIKLSLIIVCFVSLAIFLIASFSYFQTREAIIARTFDQLNSVKWEKRKRIENYFTERINELRLLASISTVTELEKMISSYPDYFDVSVFNRSEIKSDFENYLNMHSDINKVLFAVNNNLLHISLTNDSIALSSVPDVLSEELFNMNSADTLNGYFFSDIVLHGNEEFAMYVFIPVGSAKQHAAIGFEIDAKAISDIMFENNPFNGLGKSGEAYLVGSDTLMRSLSRFEKKSILIRRAGTSAVNEALQGIEGTDILNDYRGVKVLSSYGLIQISNVKWAILAEIDYNEAIIPIVDYRNNMIFLGILSALLFTALIIFTTLSITRPVVKLKNAAVEVSKGNYNMTITNDSYDELGQLTVAFNQMLKKIDEQQKFLETERITRLTEMIDWQENERQRLSRELHDSLGQVLLSIKMRIQRAKGKTNNDDTIIFETNQMLAETVQEVRNISNDLMPSVLVSYGLQGCLRNLCDTLLSASGIRANLETNIENLLPSKTQIYLYRIIQEAINNITKHSGATRVDISLLKSGSEITLVIVDNGIGFDEPKSQSGKGQGLINIKERAALLNGTCKIESEIGKGTTIFVTIPCCI